MISTRRARRLPVFLLAATWIAASFQPQAGSAEPPAQQKTSEDSSAGSQQGMDTVTIEARRRHEQELKREVSQFVSGVVVRYLNDSLVRWDTPICPLVAGLARDNGEFILARISQVARESHVPLAAENCKANLIVVVTDDPALLTQKWKKRYPTRFNTCNGVASLNDFLRSQAPVRAYYNVYFRSKSGLALDSDTVALNLLGVQLNFMLTPCAVTGGSPDQRVHYSVTQALSSVIIVVDSTRITNVNIGQLADYITLAGLAQIRLDADTGTAPTILNLFRQTGQPVQGLSQWDQSFLYSLYTTDQSSVLQVGEIKGRMFQGIER